MTRDEENRLYQQVGEIHANVDTLVKREAVNSDRIRTLEHRTYTGGAVLAMFLALKDPANWATWFQIIRGAIGGA